MRVSPVLYIAMIAGLTQCKINERPPDKPTNFAGKPVIPSSILEDHKSLISQLDSFIVLTDSAGGAAKKLKALMVHHFAEEEDYALPVLGVLPLLAHGETPEDVPNIIALSNKLNAQQNHIIAEHQLISAYTQELIDASPGRRDMTTFAKDLHHHALLEEQVLFPAVLLAGEYLNTRRPQ